MCDNCDNAGVWKVDIETASHFIGAKIEETEAYDQFKDRILVLRSDYWLLKKFVEFQYGSLSNESPPHRKVLNLIAKYSVSMPYPKATLKLPLAYPKARVQEEEEDKELLVSKDVREGAGGVAKRKRFSIPTASQVAEYAQTIQFKLDGQTFCDYYETRGWKIGNSHMKNWQAAVRTWKRKHQEEHGTNNSQSNYSLEADFRRAKEDKRLREQSSKGEISSGV